MASSGATKWQKYFAATDVITTVSKDSMFTSVTGANKQLKVGTPITVLKMDQYNSKYKVLYGSTLGTMSNADINKPNVATAKQLGIFKPQKFGVDDKDLNINSYVNKVLSHLEDDNNNIDNDLQLYLTALVNHYVGRPKTTNAQLTSLWKSSFPVSDINNDFGEIMGPIALIKTDLPKARQKRLIFGDTTIINIPPAPNEPLMDFALYKSGEPPYIFSSKSLAVTKTNTVKCQDIIKLLCGPDKQTGRESTICKRHKNTIQYKILETICAHSMIQGGYAVGNYLLNEGHREFKGLEDLEAIKQITPKTDRAFMEDKFNSYIINNGIQGAEHTPTGILYDIEKKIEKVTKDKIKLKFNDLFADAVRSQVIYIKFKINKSNGRPEWKLETSPDFKVSTGIYLRGKTTKNRLSDKIGVQT